jgi:hypothetical protein
MKGWAVIVASGLLWVACDSVSSSSIQRWKGTEKGPRKLQDAVANHQVAPKLRAEAALALTEIGQGETAEQTLAGLPAPDRNAVAAELIPLYGGVLQGSVTQARDARDGLFALRGQVPPAQQQAIDSLLLPALARDLRAGRSAGGRYSLEKIVQAEGPAATPVLLQLLEDPSAPFLPVVDLLARVADSETRARASAALVVRVGKAPHITPPLWRAMGLLGGKPAIEFLENQVEKGQERDAVLAAQALQQGPHDPALVTFAMRLAGDQRGNKAVRDEMFGLLEYVGTPEAAEGAVRVIATDPDPMVRYRAYETAVAVGKEGVIQSALEAFPASGTYKREDVVDFLVKDIQKIGATTRPALVKALSSRSPLARMTALLALETLGTGADAAEVSKLASDRGTVRGFPAGATIGREAARIAGILHAKADGGKP